MKRRVMWISTLCLGLAALLYGAVTGPDAKSFSGDAPPRAATAQQAKKGERREFTRAVVNPKPGPRYDTVRQLAAESDAIVVGTPVSKVGHRRNDSSKMIWTYFQVTILETLKGDVQKGRKLSLRVMGGRTVDANGTTIELLMPDFWKDPEKGKGYVFFLKKGTASPRGKAAPYTLVGGPQGLFEIAPWPEGAPPKSAAELAGHGVVPQVRAGDPLMRNYKGMNLAAFLQQVRRAVGAS